MKLKLIKYPLGAVSDDLTLGRFYDCVEPVADFYEVTDDVGDGHEVEKECFEEPTKQASTIDLIRTFTLNHKNLEIAFEDGMIVLRDFTPPFEPDEYRCDTIEQLEELMGAWEKLCKFKVENGS